MSTQQEYEQFADFTAQQQQQMFQLLSVSNDYDPLIMNVAVYFFGKHVCTLETQTLPHLQLAIECFIAQLPLKPEQMCDYITPEEIVSKAETVSE